MRDEDIGLASGDYVYFAHSFACDDGPATVAARRLWPRDPGGGPPGQSVRARNSIPSARGEAGARFLEGLPRRMILYPAMDLMGGRCVRLAQGDFDDATVYSDDPAEALARFAAAGADWAHVVDLDGARAGAPRQHELIADLAASAPLQAAGRRRLPHARPGRALLDAGVARVVDRQPRGDASPTLVARLARRFGADRITLALDVRIDGGAPMVATAGWTRGIGLQPVGRRRRFTRRRATCWSPTSAATACSSGPNFALLDEAVAAASRTSPSRPRAASPSLDDLRALPRPPARSSARRCGKAASTSRRRSPCPRVGSSPASTSRTAASSRASSSATIATSATSSSMRCAIATRAPTSWSSTTSPPAPRAAASTSTGCGGSRAVIDIPFAVAGGIRSRDQAARLPRRRRRQGLDQLARARAARR